ncbi:type VI secretion system membrane subunit TssM [Aeromonas veronii]
MLLHVLKILLWTSSLLLGMYLILMHGQRLAVDGYAPLASIAVRYLFCGGLALVGLLGLGLRCRRRAKAKDQEQPKDVLSAEVMSDREQALRDRLYIWCQRDDSKLPGFLLIGPAGIDKGSLLGLSGNAEEDLHCSAVGGFALFNINGRLLSQQQPEEARLWRLLLNDLQQSGAKRAPLRGVVLALAASQLQRASAGECEQLALILRIRLEELASRFGKRLPIQLIICGCEQLPGYTESLAWLPADQRELKLEFPPAIRNRELLDDIGRHINRWISALEHSELERLQLEPDVHVRAILFGFVPMWRALGQKLQVFLESALAQEPGVAQVALQSLRFSIQAAGVESPSPALLRALQSCRRAGWLRISLSQSLAWCRPRVHYLVLLVSLLISFLSFSWFRDQSRSLDQVDHNIFALQQSDNSARLIGVTANSLRRLDRLADINRIASQRRLPWAADRQLSRQAEQLYTETLKQVVLVDLQQRLQESLRSRSTLNLEPLRQSLGLYLMLGGEGSFDSQALRDWYAQWWGAEAVGLSEPQVQRLDGHLEWLLKRVERDVPLSLNRTLIEQARARLAEQPLAQRLYHKVLERMDGGTLNEFSVASALGAEGVVFFSQRSGEPQTRGVPGRYTLSGQQRLDQELEPLLAFELQEERWLMGQAEPLAVTPLKQEVLALYHQDYIENWDFFFSDLQVSGLYQAEHLPRRLLRLAQPDSPLLALLQAAARHTELAPLLPPQGWLDIAQQQGARLQQRLSLTAPEPVLAPTEHPVTRYFSPLHQWLEATEPMSGNESLRGVLRDAALFIQAGQDAASQSMPPPANDVLQRLQEEVEQVPTLLRPLLLDIVAVSQQQLQQQTRHSLQLAWTTEVEPFCERMLSGRYPFDGDATTQVPLDDFNRMFAANGVLHGFTQQYLVGQVDTRSRPWRLNKTSVDEVISGAQLATVEQAEQVREAFFPVGQEAAHFDFELSPLTMSDRIASFTLNLDGVTLDYRHGPIRPAEFEWPGKALGGEVRATVTLLDGRTIIRKTEGPWAWFRLLDEALLIPTQDPETRQMLLDFEGEEVRLQLRVGRVGAPFDRQVFNRFKCGSMSARQSSSV